MGGGSVNRGIFLMQQNVWQSVLGELELTIPKPSFDTFLKDTEILSQTHDEITIGVRNVFIRNTVEKRYHEQIKQLLVKNGLTAPKITYVQKPSQGKKTVINRETTTPLNRTPISSSAVDDLLSSPSSAPTVHTNTLNPRYTFSNFIVGSSNDLAYSACQAVAANPGVKYNPLFLYGGVGLGKTHLMQAVGNEIAKTQPDSRILYISTETFVQDFLDSIRFKKKGFSTKYRNVDVLIIDDMQFISGKEKTQEEFFHTFNALHQNNKQIIISSDKPPKSIPTLTERLRSRFEWGMAIDIQLPDYEMRCAIVEAKASLSGVQLDNPTIEYLATNIKTNVRELEGALNQLLAYAEMRGVAPDASIAEGLIGSARQSRPQHVTPKQVIDKTARYFSLDSTEICSAKRDKHIVFPRQIAMYLLRSELHLSFPKIAQELGRKDHTTAIHSVEKIEKASKLDTILREQLSEIRERLYT